MHDRSIILTTCVTLSMAIVPNSARGQDDRPAWSAPPLSSAVSVRDGRTHEVIAFTALLDALAKADVVFLGESHKDETTHRVELAVYDGLLARRGGHVVLAMEMFERDVQAELDAYLAGAIDEPTFLSRVRPWGNYSTAYRPLIERAKASAGTVLASNFPHPVRMRLGMQSRSAFDALRKESEGQVPAELYPNSKLYWRRVDNAVRGHAGMAGGIQDENARLLSIQSLWDNSMGETCAVALDKHPGKAVLHVNGGFHSAYWDGTVHQLRRRKPDAKIKTVSIIPVANPTTAELDGLPLADYVVFAEARAGDLEEDAWSVYVQRELKYRFHLPETASSDAPAPLLIWLNDDGFTASDGLDLWKDRLGDKAAIAVLDAPYRETQEDFGLGGRWYWPDSFSSDVCSLIESVERVWGYLLRHYPIDATRVCLAGEGTGATVTAAVTLLTERMDLESVALGPRRYAKVKDFSLPLPELWGDDVPPTRSLRVVGGPDDESWWISELEQYGEIGLDSRMVLAVTDPWQREVQTENALRTALGMEPRPAPATDASRRYILVPGDSPRARHWSRLHALWASKDGVSVAAVNTPPLANAANRISTEIRPGTFAVPHALPQCPGPFGGTTVVVLPADATAQEIESWLAVQENDPIARESRFHRVRIATAAGEWSLVKVLKELQSAGRKNVLIVPAAFCADPAWMRTLRRSVRHLENQMTFHWLPGLGGRRGAIPSADLSATEL